ncbi:DUF4142 domain-containing protein [Nonomuraea rhodomycinica]|uniref:DUF4142 domain-containing protein n=1 Tax=Nonomuraea rhodomycinica TaxID=1712872 RepID=A0A7Y6IS01_9ACTN|nr:DUF4142 domain-containing protein [Nonomuraea rhodomycinica]NUW42054.1 DUF4142 domain-containing protein [Nonomuraea rhodomycinica]
MSLRVAFAGAATVAAMALLGGPPVSALGGPPVSGQAEVSKQDRKFLRLAHQGNLAEIIAGEVARVKGADDAVRSIAAELVTDHTRLDKAVKDAADRLDVSLPDRPAKKDRAAHRRISRLHGHAFDRAWLAAMIAGHRQALQLGEQELRDGSSPAVKELAQAAAPVIRKHLDQLLQAQK